MRGFDVDLVYYDVVRQTPEVEQALGSRNAVGGAPRRRDIVTLHVFLAEGPKHLIGAQELGQMKSSAVRTAHRAAASSTRWRSTRRSAPADHGGHPMFEVEPTLSDNRDLQLSVVVPHMATANRDSMIKKSAAANFRGC